MRSHKQDRNWELARVRGLFANLYSLREKLGISSLDIPNVRLSNLERIYTDAVKKRWDNAVQAPRSPSDDH